MLLRGLNKVVEIVTIAFLSIITLIVPIEVVLRFGFGTSLIITEELSRYLMVWVVFLASSLALRESAHINIEVLVGRFTGKTRALFNLLASLILAGFMVVVMIEGLLVLPYQVDQYISTIPVSIVWFYLAIPVGFLLMILNLLPTIWHHLQELRGQPLAHPAPDMRGES